MMRHLILMNIKKSNGEKGEYMITPMSKGSATMVSDFIDRSRYMKLSDEEFPEAKDDSTIKQYARVRMEHGES